MHLVYGSCLKYLKNEEKSKDAVMELYEHLAEVLLKHEIQHFKSWLYRVTYNHCMQILRKDKNLINKAKYYKADAIPFMDSEEEAHLTAEKEELLVHLESCIEKLKDAQKNCIELFYLKEQCYNEIVQQTGYALKKVKSYIQNGKRNLMICMNKKNEAK